MQSLQTCGPHRYSIEQDVVYWQMVDVMEESHLEVLLASVDSVLAHFHHSILLVDCAQAHSLSVEARRRYATWLKNNPYPNRASVFYAASGEMRAFLLLAQRGAELLSGKRSAIEIFDDEASARAHAAELRNSWVQPPA